MYNESSLKMIPMKQLFNVLNLVKQTKRVNSLFNYVSQRGARYDTKITWNEPEKYKHYHPLRSGDTTALEVTNPEEIHAQFRTSEELDFADERVKKIFSLGYQKRRRVFDHYRYELVEKVKEHALDKSSRGVMIAELTAKIRYFQNVISAKPVSQGYVRNKIHKLIGKRRAHLNKLRSEDYKKFEWILEVLELQFQPGFVTECRKVSRKESLILLAKLKAEKLKEEKLAILRKTFDDQKALFLEKKLETLKKIKGIEEKFNFSPSVSEDEIQTCMKKLEKIKFEVAENARVGYQRKIHPYLLEPYHENWLREKEKKGELIREEMELYKGNKSSQVVTSLKNSDSINK